MSIAKSYIVDETGNPKSVVIDFESFNKIENPLLDYGLGKAMEEVENDEEIDIEEAKRIVGFNKRKV